MIKRTEMTIIVITVTRVHLKKYGDKKMGPIMSKNHLIVTNAHLSKYGGEKMDKLLSKNPLILTAYLRKYDDKK